MLNVMQNRGRHNIKYLIPFRARLFSLKVDYMDHNI